MNKTNIAVMGFGVVGSGTVELIYKNKELLERRCGSELEVTKILDLRDFPDSEFADKLTKNFEDILNDDSITVVCELMGGKTFAYDYTKRLLEKGKSVVTSNKELVAYHGAELLAIAKKQGCHYMFEASVGGGIPIIRPLYQCLGANKIERIAGIVNGTTNFILTKMIYDQISFEDALAMAQQLGYAEKDPSADIDGHDPVRKLCILGSLAFGKHIYPEYIHRAGIRDITLDDVEYAENAGYKVKLIGMIEDTGDGLVATVCPRLVPINNPLSTVNDVFNGIMVTGDALGDSVFYGRGAGKFPTASAVVADVLDAIRNKDRELITLNWADSENGDFIRHYKSAEVKEYVRIHAPKADSLKKYITDLFGYVDFIPRKYRSDDELAFITPMMVETDIDERLNKLREKATVKKKMRLL